MKRHYIIFIILSFFLISNISFAQKKGKESDKKETTAKKGSKKDDGKPKKPKRKKSEDEETADKYFEIEEYYQAAQFYDKVVKVEPTNDDAANALGVSYENMFNYKKAEDAYKKLADMNSQWYPLARYKYAQMLKTNGKYEEAKSNYEKFLASYTPEAGTTDYYKDHAMLEMNGSALAIEEMKKPQREYNFEVIKRPLNSQNSDYAPCIAENDSSLFITSAREGSKGGSVDNKFGEAFSDMYHFTKKEGTTWIKAVDHTGFNDLNTEFNDASGVLSNDKTKYYFTSCKDADTKGGADAECAIYFSQLENGKWSKPVKLNDNVNQPGSWNAQPTINKTVDTLFFVSKRVGGKGMHDIWFCTAKSGSNDWGPATNLANINTPFIDMSPCFHDSLKVLFFASNGHEGFGGLDLFMSKAPVFDKIRNLGLPFNSNRDDFYMVAGKKKGYLSSNRDGGIGNDDIYSFDLLSRQTIITVVDQDSLGVATSVSITGEVSYKFNHLPAEGVEIALLDADGNIVKTVRTNENGLFRFDNLPGIAGYRVLLDEDDPNLTVNAKYDVEKLAVTRSDKPATRILFENVYFDFDKADLRPEGKKVLDDLVAYYKKNKDKKIQIELQANTDAFGSDEYNKKLSKARGDAAQAYLMKNGVNRSALTVSAQGSTKPLATNDNAAGRQLNRRIEFYIIGGEGFETNAMAYIIEPKTDIYSVAKKFNMTVEEIKELNALDGVELQAFRPLRVRRTGDKDLYAPITSASYQLSKEEEMKYVPDHSVAASGGAKKSWKSNSSSKAEAATPEEGYHIVEPLNTWYSIAKQYNVSVNDLKALNSASGNILQIGQKIRVSGAVSEVPASSSGKSFGQNNSTDTDGDGKYKVQDGDTMYSIAKKFGLTVEDLMQMNSLDSYTLYKSMRLKVKK